MPQPPADAAPALHALGPRAVLADLPDLAAVLDLRERVLADPPEHLLAGRAGTVPAARTLLLRFDRPLDEAARTRLARHLGRLTAQDPGAQAPADRERVVEIPVRYDGADLTACAEHLGCTPEEVVRRHTETRWRAGFAGFAPGFAYLTPDGGADGTPDATGPGGLEVPRRDSPRTRVPAGSVALAGTFSAVYPQDSPGGWQLIGRTDAPLWDVDRDPPALIAPGDVVRFREITDDADDAEPRGAAEDSPDGSPRATDRDSGAAAETPEPRTVRDDTGAEQTAARLRILAPGLSTTLQDAGRPGLDDLGVGPSGWADPLAAHAANRLVGNPPGSAVLENALGRLRVMVPEDAPDAVLALTGARVQASLSGSDTQGPRPAPLDRPFLLRAGQTLEIGPVRCGLRLVLAVRGGFTGRAVLGSLATDTLSGAGPAPLTRGDEVPVGPTPRAAVEPWCPPVPLPEDDAVLRLPLAPGPRADWFADDSMAALHRSVWRVAEQSDRVAARLEPEPADAVGAVGVEDRGPASGRGSSSDADATRAGATHTESSDAPAARLRRAPEREGAELASEPLVRGSVQIPPNGHPVVFLADRPVTGGYPVLGLVAPEHLRLLAQAPPGTRVVLEPPVGVPASPADQPAGAAADPDSPDPAGIIRPDSPENAAPTEESRCAPS
ncbi:5-oxoprolinase subunit B/C family protein [Rothia kristinae]|uniref:5-oxoprolinase subunit B/C family protein n=1 Tax=Rothia kristinae TaxID=37923 RepID=UPI0010F15CF2|nr:5-oxoprolinase/urea amidolyase family protein [Rothia kristinae]TDP54661.1 KipI family sensor histidine kinase inhibitor [Kocuria sp. AG109]